MRSNHAIGLYLVLCLCVVFVGCDAGLTTHDEGDPVAADYETAQQPLAAATKTETETKDEAADAADDEEDKVESEAINSPKGDAVSKQTAKSLGAADTVTVESTPWGWEKQIAEHYALCEQDPDKTYSKWWSNPCCDYLIKVDGYEFDAEPDKGSSTEGELDGPWGHNGRYEITTNDGDTNEFEMEANAGDNDAQDNDFDITISIDGKGNAKVTGTVKGKSLGAGGVKGTVTGKGTSNRPYKLSIPNGDETVVLTWNPEC